MTEPAAERVKKPRGITRGPRSAIRKDGTPARPMGRPMRPNWQQKVLEHLEKHGTYYKACRVAGVDEEAVRRYRNAHPEFDAQCQHARELHADELEEKMAQQAEETGNPVGYIVRLKAIRPAQYIEKHAIMSLNMTAALPADEVGSVLRAMLSHAAPHTLARLAELTATTDLPILPSPAPTME